MVRLDSDGMYYLNYFNSLQQGRDYSLIIGKSNEQFVSDIISMCDTQMSVYIDNNNVWTKYEWLKKYTEQSMNFCIGEPVVYKKRFGIRYLEE